MHFSSSGRALVLVMSLTSTLVACGGGQNETSDVAPPIAQAPAPAPGPSLGPVPTPAPPPVPGAGNPLAPVGFTYSVDPSTVAVTTTARSNGYRQAEGIIAFGTGCAGQLSTYDAVETGNVIVFADGSATLAQRQAAARLADATVRTLRDRFGINETVGLNDARVRICLTRMDGGSAGFNTMQVSDAAVIDSEPGNRNSNSLQALLMHELTHVAQMQALGCRDPSYRHEKWFLEGIALRLAGQDVMDANELATYRAAQFPGEATPFDDIDVDGGSLQRYLGYRMAVDVLLHASGRTERDLYTFLRSVGAASGCPSSNVGWKPAFDSFFGLALRSTGPLGSGFWSIAPNYTQP